VGSLRNQVLWVPLKMEMLLSREPHGPDLSSALGTAEDGEAATAGALWAQLFWVPLKLGRLSLREGGGGDPAKCSGYP
jgi:hypothetical protein